MTKLNPASVSLQQYAELRLRDKYALAKSIEKTAIQKFRFQYLGSEQLALPVFANEENGILFKFIPGGSFSMGLSEKEERAAYQIDENPSISISEMRPVSIVEVRPILISVSPILGRELVLAGDQASPSMLGVNYPAMVSHEFASSFAQRFGGRLPSEAEWEYCCRGNTNTLFCFGDSLPSESELSEWLVNDFSGLRRIRGNGFGLFGLFCGEWCGCEWRENLALGSHAETGIHVVRSGGAQFWPWQDEEWVWCMSAIRMPSTDVGEDPACGFRIVFDCTS